jgi:thiol-disulfide isomerase/thioredoxin
MNLTVCVGVKIPNTYGFAFTTDVVCVEIMTAYRTCYHSMFPSIICIIVLLAAVEKYDIEKNYVAVKTVLLNTDKLNCHICDEILEGLENIDDECDVYGIHLVKIQDPQLAKRYSIKTFPALVYFRNGNPLLYEGKLYLSVAGDSFFILFI